jgi:hypothetical protein
LVSKKCFLISKSFTKIGQLSNKESKVMEHFLFLQAKYFQKLNKPKEGLSGKNQKRKFFLCFKREEQE